MGNLMKTVYVGSAIALGGGGKEKTPPVGFEVAE
jgi:hypothetical protein